MSVAGVTYPQDSFKKRIASAAQIVWQGKGYKKEIQQLWSYNSSIIYLFLVGVGSNNSVPFRSQLIML